MTNAFTHGFMKRISTRPTITAAERKEIELYLQDLDALNRPRLTAEEERALGVRAVAGDRRARNQLVEANLRLALTVAKSVERPAYMSFADCLQEANCGLCAAASKWNPTLYPDTRFATFAGPICEQTIERAAHKQSDAASIPRRVYIARNQVRRARAEWLVDHDEWPDDATTCRLAGITPETLEAVQGTFRKLVRLDDEIESDDGGVVTVADVIAGGLDTEDEALGRAVAAEVLDLIDAVLDKREQLVVRLAHGIGQPDGQASNYVAIARAMGLTRATVARIHEKAVEKLATAYRDGIRDAALAA